MGVLWVVAKEARRLSREVVSLLISIAAQTASSVVNHRHVEARLEEEANRRKFYRDALQAVTRGKLIVCEHPEVEAAWRGAGEEKGCQVIETTADVPAARDLVEAVLKSAGFPEERCYDLALCTCEAAANVIKHADRGRVSVRMEDDLAFVRIEDQGPGIDFAQLPDAVLTAGYSTAPSLGMGYSMLLELADRVHLATGEGGTTVLLEVTRTEADPLAAFSALLDGA
jgi:anti-sigma regulatory factor (Ser/Thr protein kinase)